MTQLVKAKIHSTLGASSASRWMSCPGSVRLSEGAPPRPTSRAAIEGTGAHALAELCLRHQQDPTVYIGTTLEGVEVTDEMAEFVRLFVEYCQKLPGLHFIEQQFSLAELNPPAPMFGTADFVAVDYDGDSVPGQRILEVVDLKYGTGVVVDVNANKQLRYYALGCFLGLPARVRELIDRVRITIVQPRAAHVDGVIRSEELSIAELIDYTNELMDAARATLEPDAPLVTGSHCRWCPASGLCPAQQEAASLAAQTDFSVLPPAPPPVALVPIPQLAEWAGKFHILEEWISAVRARLVGELEAGREVPGYKLVEKRATREWADAGVVEQWLRTQGYAGEDIFVMKLKSPAQVEKLVGKKNVPAEYVVKQSSGTKMVSNEHPGQAVAAGPAVDFAALTAGEQEN
jgi:hypothetical protein